jgi:hypothetical protein
MILCFVKLDAWKEEREPNAMEEKREEPRECEKLLTRKEALQKMGKYAAYSAAAVTILITAPDKARAAS